MTLKESMKLLAEDKDLFETPKTLREEMKMLSGDGRTRKNQEPEEPKKPTIMDLID